MKKAVTYYLFLLVFVLAGAVMIVMSFTLNNSYNSFVDKAVMTTGEIDSIRTKTDSDDNVSHNVIVSYDVEGKHYRGNAGYYNGSMKEGHSIKIYYDPDNPREFKVDKSGDNTRWILLVVGIVFGGVGLYVLILSIKGSSRGKSIKNGVSETCTVLSVDPDSSIQSSLVQFVVVTFERENSAGGEQSTVLSEKICLDNSVTVSVGDKISVTFDINDNNKFHIDISALSNTNKVIESEM